MDEKTIILNCQKNKSEAQKQLYSQYGPYLMGVAMRYSSNREDAEEIFHDTMIKVFKNINSFKFESSFKTWSTKICVNTCLDFLRKRKNTLIIEHIDERVLEIRDSNPETEVSLNVESALEVLNKLPSNQKIIINLFLIEEYSHKEISKMLNITEEASRTQYSRARKKLTELFNLKINKNEQQRR